MDANQIKKLISECMQELKESMYSQNQMGLNQHGDTIQDPDTETAVKRQNWGELINTCVHDPHSRFMETYFIPALSANRETIGAMLEALADNEDVQNEIYKALDDYNYKGK